MPFVRPTGFLASSSAGSPGGFSLLAHPILLALPIAFELEARTARIPSSLYALFQTYPSLVALFSHNTLLFYPLRGFLYTPLHSLIFIASPKTSHTYYHVSVG